VRLRRTSYNCRQVARVLQAYLDDELDPRRAPLVTAHLEACRRCGLDAQTWNWLKATVAATVLVPPEEPERVERLRVFVEDLVAGS
jgi:anti-sigma factor RsiW